MTEKARSEEDRSTKDFPRDPEEARLDLEVTREELGDTIGELTHRLNVPARAKERTDQLATTAKANPVPFVAAGLAVGSLIALLVIRKAKK